MTSLGESRSSRRGRPRGGSRRASMISFRSSTRPSSPALAAQLSWTPPCARRRQRLVALRRRGAQRLHRLHRPDRSSRGDPLPRCPGVPERPRSSRSFSDRATRVPTCLTRVHSICITSRRESSSTASTRASIASPIPTIPRGADFPTDRSPLTGDVPMLRRVWALPTLGGAGGQSIAGAFSTSTHGGDVRLPPIADAVAAIHLVGCEGRQYWIEPAPAKSGAPLTDTARLQARLPDVTLIRDNQLFGTRRGGTNGRHLLGRPASRSTSTGCVRCAGIGVGRATCGMSWVASTSPPSPFSIASRRSC